MKTSVMSGLLFLIFLFFLPCTRAAPVENNPVDGEYQKGKYRLIRLHYENSSGEKGITIYDYDGSGIAQTAIWKLLDGTRHSQNYHTYDRNGNLILKYREFSDGLTSRTIYDFDDGDKLVRETFERSDSVSGITCYVYDQSGKLIEADCKGLNGWFYGLIKYRYDDSKRKSGAEILREGKSIGTIEYGYDEQGYLVSEFWDFPDSWSQTFIYEYEIVNPDIPPSFTSSNVFITDTDEFRVVKETYDYNKETGGPSFYEYGEDGRLIRKIFERSDSLRTVTTYEYADNGTLEGSFRKYSSGLTADFRYEFDGNRRLAHRSFARSDGITGSEEYFYNEKGLLEKGIYTNFDTWLNGTILFDHDKSGNLTRGIFKGDNGFDALIYFDHDEYGNITRIHWEFSFKKTQTYGFIYEKMNL